MALQLSLDWTHERLVGLEADVSGSSVQIKHVFNMVWPDSSRPEDSTRVAGDWLKSQLKSSGISSRNVHLVLPRELLVARRLELPEAPDSELPDLVRFQAAARSTTPLDQLALDFVPLPVSPDEHGRSALMVTMDRKRLQVIVKTCQEAGLNVQSVQASPFGVAEVAVRSEQQRGEDPSLATLVIFQDARRVEISILQRLGLLFTHHIQLDPEDPHTFRSTLAEINRSLVVWNQTFHGAEIARVCLIHAGDVDSSLEQALSEQFGGRLHVIDPVQDSAVSCAASLDAASVSSAAPALGVLLAEIKPLVPAIDLIYPRQPPVQRDLRKQKIIAYGALAAVLLIGVIGWAWWNNHGLEQHLEALSAENRELTRTLDQGKPQRQAYEMIDQWTRHAVAPLDELDRLVHLLPGTDRLLLESLHMTPSRGEKVVKITGSGIAKSQRDIQNFEQSLAEANYLVVPKIDTENPADPYEYKRKFPFEIERFADQVTSEDTGSEAR